MVLALYPSRYIINEAISNVTVKQGRLVTTYKTRKAKNGAVVIEPEQYRDPLDLPQNELEKLVQGLVWREEHFGGLTLQMIADKYGHSKSHIHINILKTLEFA